MKYFLVLFFLFWSCSKTENLNNFSLQVEVNGLKKGTLFLEKFSDSSLFKIDSGYFNGNNSVEFRGKIDGPEIMIITLSYENESDPKQFPFFVEKSEMIVKTRLKNFGYEVYSKGSKNDSIYRAYLEINRRFNNEKLDLISKSLEFKKIDDIDSVKFYDEKLLAANKRQFLHNANFAIRHSEYTIAPYIAISDLRESTKILDTIYKSLDERIKKSKYALELKSLIN